MAAVEKIAHPWFIGYILKKCEFQNKSNHLLPQPHRNLCLNLILRTSFNLLRSLSFQSSQTCVYPLKIVFPTYFFSFKTSREISKKLVQVHLSGRRIRGTTLEVFTVWESEENLYKTGIFPRCAIYLNGKMLADNLTSPQQSFVSKRLYEDFIKGIVIQTPFSMSLKPSCHIQFPHAFSALRCVFEVITFFSIDINKPR